MSDPQADRLAGIDRASTSQGDDPVALSGAVFFQAVEDVLLDGVRADAVEQSDGEAGAICFGGDAAGEAAPDHPAVRHEQRPLHAEAACFSPQFA